MLRHRSGFPAAAEPRIAPPHKLGDQYDATNIDAYLQAVGGVDAFTDGGKDPGKIHTDRRINIDLLAMNAKSAVSMPLLSMWAIR
jgi:hypothetical protein